MHGKSFSNSNNKNVVSQNNYKNWIENIKNKKSEDFSLNNIYGYDDNRIINSLFKVPETKQSLTKNEFISSPFMDDLSGFVYGKPIDRLWSEIKVVKNERLLTPLKIKDIKEYIKSQSSFDEKKRLQILLKKNPNIRPAPHTATIEEEYPYYFNNSSPAAGWPDNNTEVLKNNLYSIRPAEKLAEIVYKDFVKTGGKSKKNKKNKKKMTNKRNKKFNKIEK